MFGTTNDIEYKEKEMYTAKPRKFIILPSTKFFFIWNMVVVFLLFYTATILPYRISFIDDSNVFWKVWDALTDFLFFTDVIVN
jgi:hypothetical protein